MKKKLINLISEEELKRCISLFGRETAWGCLCKDVDTEKHPPKVHLRFSYEEMFANRFFRLNEIIKLNTAKPVGRYSSWISADRKKLNIRDEENFKYFETDLELFIKDIGTKEWEEMVLKDFDSSDFIKTIIKEIEENETDYITTHTGDVDSWLASKWRETHLFNEAQMMAMMTMAYFVLKYNPISLKFSLYDMQFGNLGGIEGEVFDSVEEAFERLEVYFIDLFDKEEEE